MDKGFKYFIGYKDDNTIGSSVKWGHLAHLEPNSTNAIFSTKILCGHLAYFGPDSVTTIKKKTK